MDMKRFFLYFITIAALALAGCGGNGGGTPMDGMDGDMTGVMTPTPLVGPACSLGGAGIDCGLTVAMPIADADGDGNFDADLTTGRPTGLTVDGNKVTHTTVMPEFAMSDATPAALMGFPGSVQTRTIDGTETTDEMTDMVTVYTDQMPNGSEEYQDYYANATEGDRDGVSSIQNDADGNVITFDRDVSDIADDIMVGAFPSGDSQTWTYADDETGTMDMDEEMRGGTEHEGTFHGIPGTFECTGGACTAMTDADGNLSMLDGMWTFTPDEAGTDDPHMVPGVKPDTNYLQFGYWVQATTDDDDETTYGIRTFASGDMPFTASAIASLVGFAKYEGPATGLYVQKSFDVEANEFVVSSSGQFTADAELTAYFSGNDVAMNLQNSINGTVTTFMDGDEMIDKKWTVTLEKADYGVGDAANTFTSTTSTGMVSVPGAWTGGFFVSSEDEAMPGAVAGEFNAHFSPGGGQSPGHAVGAFGAMIQDE